MSRYQDLLERLRTARLPKYGALRWDGEKEELIASIHFEEKPTDSLAEVCERAHRYFSQLTDAEWRSLDIEVTIRLGKPVRATLKPLPEGTINTGRLRQLEDIPRR